VSTNLQKVTHKFYHIMLYRVYLADLTQVTDKFYHINIVHLALIEIQTLVVIGPDFTGSCTSNYHTITTAPEFAMFNSSVQHVQGGNNLLYQFDYLRLRGI
jgi:hypothetical protein